MTILAFQLPILFKTTGACVPDPMSTNEKWLCHFLFSLCLIHIPTIDASCDQLALVLSGHPHQKRPGPHLFLSQMWTDHLVGWDVQFHTSVSGL